MSSGTFLSDKLEILRKRLTEIEENVMEVMETIKDFPDTVILFLIICLPPSCYFYKPIYGALIKY